MAYNTNLDQFLMFYSQSEAGNGLTRGLENALARNTYVPTKLDRELTAAILNQQYHLVILTGNAGDGKTAFIQKVEEAAVTRGATPTPHGSLGSRFVLDGRQYQTLYDGSVEVPGASNQQMLTDFFSDFAGETPSYADVCVVAAMNEGKLVDFLSQTTTYPWLSRTLLDHLQKDAALPDDIAVVNLNLRAIVDSTSAQTNCLLDQIVDRYVAEEFWTMCDQCEARLRCPVKFNVDTFRYRSTAGLDEKDREAVEAHNLSARVARSRLKSLFQMLHLRKRIHMTVRDLRSVLAFMLFGKHTCAQIEADIQSGTADFTPRYYYNALFNSAEKDRVLHLLTEFDVGEASLPMMDSRLSFLDPKSADSADFFSTLHHIVDRS
jgi:hypothetical protein